MGGGRDLGGQNLWCLPGSRSKYGGNLAFEASMSKVAPVWRPAPPPFSPAVLTVFSAPLDFLQQNWVRFAQKMDSPGAVAVLGHRLSRFWCDGLFTSCGLCRPRRIYQRRSSIDFLEQNWVRFAQKCIRRAGGTRIRLWLLASRRIAASRRPAARFSNRTRPDQFGEHAAYRLGRLILFPQRSQAIDRDRHRSAAWRAIP